MLFLSIEENLNSSDVQVYEKLFSSFQVIWNILNNQHIPSFESNTMLVGDLIGVGNKEGLLTELISLLVNIHNGFISTYNKSFCIPTR